METADLTTDTAADDSSAGVPASGSIADRGRSVIRAIRDLQQRIFNTCSERINRSPDQQYKLIHRLVRETLALLDDHGADLVRETSPVVVLPAAQDVTADVHPQQDVVRMTGAEPAGMLDVGNRSRLIACWNLFQGAKEETLARITEKGGLLGIAEAARRQSARVEVAEAALNELRQVAARDAGEVASLTLELAASVARLEVAEAELGVAEQRLSIALAANEAPVAIMSDPEIEAPAPIDARIDARNEVVQVIEQLRPLEAKAEPKADIVTEQAVSDPVETLAEATPAFAVTAAIRTTDGAIELQFDAASYLQRASNGAIAALVASDFSGTAPVQVLLESMRDDVRTISDAIIYVDQMRAAGKPVELQFGMDGAAATAWIEAERPAILQDETYAHDQIDSDESDPPDLDESNDSPEQDDEEVEAEADALRDR